MIQMYTYLDVADNTGAKECMCIKALGGTRRRYAGLGDVIIASVKKAISGGDVKPGDVVRGVVVRCRKATRREDGHGPVARTLPEGDRAAAGREAGPEEPAEPAPAAEDRREHGRGQGPAGQ